MSDDTAGSDRARRLTDDERRERGRERRRRYRETHADQVRESTRRWKADHPEKVKEYSERSRAAHREQIRSENRERERGRAAKARKAAAAAERRRAKSREQYAADPESNRDYQRERRRAQRAANPEGYREAKRQRNKRWRDSHREEQNAKLRAKHHDHPEIKRAGAQRYYDQHGDEVRERRRTYYWANREMQLHKQHQWRARQQRRRGLGLPARRLHRVTATERTANTAAAHEFFTRARTPEELERIRREPKPSAQEIAEWERSSVRARLAAAVAADMDRARPLAMSRLRESEREAAARRKRAAEDGEAKRMDDIAREINTRLRHGPRRAHAVRDAEGRRASPPSAPGGLSL
ncbi:MULTISPECIES: hypothetical protein [Microbacterium]|uniref:Uncharacterized protein n=1 Tax=Microbacterium wangchenii TaxID=2541726 RepID=A0ABX5SV75_9MICO|nr:MULTISPECIES: hypothetical protein [Microbacterium]MCK6065777.1 hypothetical protein [Microbacterium sp. EYE_512]QBR90093.1 hypothetical protein E4K62_16225 [Microbacterium wangchenii]